MKFLCWSIGIFGMLSIGTGTLALLFFSEMECTAGPCWILYALPILLVLSGFGNGILFEIYDKDQ